MNKKFKIAISGIHYPLSMMSYFIRAFERRDDVELLLVGPYTGTWIPWGGGMHIDPKYLKVPQIALPKNFMYPIPFQLLSNNDILQQFGVVDLWLQIDAGWHFTTRPQADVVAHIQTDPHAINYANQPPSIYSDIVFCMQTPYMENHHVFLPYAYDPTVHYPMPEVQKEYDVCLVGLLYQHREQLIHSLRLRGMNVYYGLGEVFDEYRLRYNKSKVALNWSSLKDMPARVWEAFAMGIPLVSGIIPSIPDMDKWFTDGVDYLGFTDTKHGADQVEWLLHNPDEAQEMAKNAREIVLPHTWDSRVLDIMKACKLL